MGPPALPALLARFLHPVLLRVLIVLREVIVHSARHLAPVVQKEHGHPCPRPHQMLVWAVLLARGLLFWVPRTSLNATDALLEHFQVQLVHMTSINVCPVLQGSFPTL